MSKKYSNFNFPENLRKLLVAFQEDIGEEYAQELLWNYMKKCTDGTVDTDKETIIFLVNLLVSYPTVLDN